MQCRPTLEGIDVNSLGEEEADQLIQPFDEEEIKRAVWSCEGSKASGLQF